jgi:hypothetical protein
MSILLVTETVLPTVALALTSGPSSPDFSGFTPVSASEMVNTFTGDFNYNLPVIEIPGPHGSGYALSLSYGSGVSVEQEASWVGFGWNLNPGSITRNLRGLPDDMNGEEVEFYNKTRPSWTAVSGLNTNLELFSKDIVPVGINAGITHRINNYTGYQRTTGLGVNAAGMAGLSVTFSPEGVTWDPFVSPLALLSFAGRNIKAGQNVSTEAEASKKATSLGAFVKGIIPTGFSKNIGDIRLSSYSTKLAQYTPRPSISPQYGGLAINWSTSLQGNPSFVPMGVQVGKEGRFDLRFNKYKESKKVYGYLHSQQGEGNNGVMDYYVEKDRPFSRQDVFLGMPFSGYDVFSATGEGVIGGFRAYPEQTGYFSPQHTTSKSTMLQTGFEVMAGPNVGIGMDIGMGFNSTETDGWDSPQGYTFADSPFRFNGDRGGGIGYKKRLADGSYGNSTNADRARVHTTRLPGFREGHHSGAGEYALDRESSNGSSSYIHTNYNSNGKIGGFRIYNKDGHLFRYNQPVAVRNETTLSVDVNAADQTLMRFLTFKPLNLSKNTSDGKYTVKDNILNSTAHRTVTGEINPNEYSQSFLLTEILTPDYFDTDGDNAVSAADWGGWTKFDYRKRYGKGKNWYRYRMPYNGLSYMQGSISDPKDDTGSVSTGEKEVYYLKTIRTRTHIACFVTNKTVKSDFNDAVAVWDATLSALLQGSGNNRLDGLGALDLTASDDPAAVNTGAVRHNTNAALEYLERIVLLPLSETGRISGSRPVKTVCFEYDYSLVPNVVNNRQSTFNYGNANVANPQSGKLTLRKVWMEYQGIVSAKISPYLFNYNYPAPAPDSKLYPFYSEEAYSRLTGNLQNPEYAPFALDSWGNLMPDGQERRMNGIPWIKQAAFLNSSPAFDPAAYNLKSIRLPSGGAIHIQYEPDDYAFVHNRNAMAMASIVNHEAALDGNQYCKTPAYFINTEDLGVAGNNQQGIDSLTALMKTHFGFNAGDGSYSKKVYYRFLFSLTGKNSATLGNFQSDYITGYASIKSIEKAAHGNGWSIRITLAGENSEDGERALTPQQACYEFVTGQRQGKVQGNNGVEANFEEAYDDRMIEIANSANGNNLTVPFLERFKLIPVMFDISLGAKFITYTNMRKKEIAQSFNGQLSFLKLPVLHRKVGGGVRVRRILLHDSGIETGSEAVLGTNYRYVLTDGKTSSGVAANEPAGAREENPLIDFMPVKGTSLFNRLVSGDNLLQTEGPLGESLLPGASVGYSRVVAENIHTGKTGTGFTVYEYCTAREFPFDMYYDHPAAGYDFEAGSGVEKTAIDETRDELQINAGLIGYSVDKVWMAQGFRFIHNDMHGQVRKTSSYGGSYLTGSSGEDLSQSYLSTSQEYEYYKPGEKVSTIWLNAADNRLLSAYTSPGREMEITREARRIVDVSYNFNIEVDLSGGLMFFPPIFIGIVPSFSYTRNLIATHVTCKVISYPAILKSRTDYVDGITSKTEYLGFNRSTGEAVMVGTTDSFAGSYAGSNLPKGKVYSLTVPAEWCYPEMGRKTTTAANSNQLSATAASFTVYNTLPDSTWWNAPVNVINAAIQTYRKNWDTPQQQHIAAHYGIAGTAALNSRWRAEAMYAYSDALPYPTGTQPVFQKGYYDIGAANRFNWNPTVQNPLSQKWLKSSAVSLYSPHGEVLEERDVLNIPSTAVYGRQYAGSVPSAVASNADYGSLLFRDFEGADTLGAVINNPHSGKKAAAASSVTNLFEGVTVTAELKKQGALFKAWIQTGAQQASIVVNGAAIALTRVASVGQWQLFEAEVPAAQLPIAGTALHGTLTGMQPGDYIDDIRFQPLHSTSTCFVYDDRQLQLLTQFDDQHFGLYYQYDMEGKLVRKIIETERGRHTVQEVNYNVPSDSR